MVRKLNIGIVGIQGAISEHVFSMQKTLEKTKNPGKVLIIKHKDDLNNIDGLILPGGESTTISNILNKSGIYKEIINRIDNNDLPIMGTCAGCVLLSKELSEETEDVKLLKAMDIKVKRNAFGRQKDSFEEEIKFNDFEEPYHAIFIRAPVIEKSWGKCKPLAKIDNKIVAAKQNKFLALSFHPELTNDLRIHTYFLNLI